MVFTNPGERDKNNKFSSLNLVAYFAITMLTAALETAYGTKKSMFAFLLNSMSPAAELMVITFAKAVCEALRRRGRKILIVLITPRVLTLNFGFC